MQVYHMTFTKKNGQPRDISFVKTADLPETFLSANVAGTGAAREYKDGQELVWDIDADAFRIVNWNTVQGQVQITEEELDFQV